MNRKTRDDARAQIVLGTMGSLAGDCSEEYLLALRADAFEFIAAIERRIYRDAVVIERGEL